jgi:hypothetical protein
MTHLRWNVLLLLLGACVAQTGADARPEISEQVEDLGAHNPSRRATCYSDADCHVAANYCDGCECVVLGPGESLPKCTGTPVQCFVDPCRGVEAHCDNGHCGSGPLLE